MKNLWLFERHRLEILKALMACPKHLCGCDVGQKLKMRKNLASYHLEKLVRQGVVRASPVGRKKQYSIEPAKKNMVKQILKIVQN